MTKKLFKTMASALVFAVSVFATSGTSQASVMETLPVVPFFGTNPGGVGCPSAPGCISDTATSNTYYDWVRIDISGIGQSSAQTYNDAFYLFNIGTGASLGSVAPYYQLGFDTAALTLIPKPAFLKIIGGLPIYNPAHTYSFYLNTGVMTASVLHFGVTDGVFSDNTGAYSITVSQVPEPSALALIGLALLSMFGFAMMRRRGSI